MACNSSLFARLSVWSALLCLVLPGVAVAADILGQVASPGIRVEGVSTPVGATLMSPSLVATTAGPGLVYLSNGRTLAIGPRTEVSLAAVSDAEVEVAVHVGEVAYRAHDGEVMTVGRSGSFVLEQEEVIGEGRRVVGLVAVLTAAAAAGESVLQVDAADRLDPDLKVLVRTADGAIQEVHCIESVSVAEFEVELQEALAVGFPTGGHLIQGSEVQEAVDRGDAEDWCELPAAGWSAQKKLAVAAASVLGAFAVVDFAEGADRPVGEAEEVSKRRP